MSHRPPRLLSVLDLEPSEMLEVVELGLHFKRLYYEGRRTVGVLEGKSIALLFERPSTRTRVSFELAVRQLGGHPIVLYSSELQLARGETVADTARTLSRYVDGIVARVSKHQHLVELADNASVPVINALSDREHPVQALGDLMTVREKLGRLTGVSLALVGDGRSNVFVSLLLAGAALGLDLRLASPRPLWPSEDVISRAEELARSSGASVRLFEDPKEAVTGADVVYTDVWVSMGCEPEREWRVKLLEPYRVDAKLMRSASPAAIFMHCLPAKRGEEVTDEVLDGPSSVVWDQAENRLHIQKGLLYYLYRRVI
ncbi:MAG: ornithine carbamoyltransferase [Fervidicoccaceae archaeon]